MLFEIKLPKRCVQESGCYDVTNLVLKIEFVRWINELFNRRLFIFIQKLLFKWKILQLSELQDNFFVVPLLDNFTVDRANEKLLFAAACWPISMNLAGWLADRPLCQQVLACYSDSLREKFVSSIFSALLAFCRKISAACCSRWPTAIWCNQNKKKKCEENAMQPKTRFEQR